MKPIQIIDQALLARTSAQAEQSPRLRKNHNFHASDDAVCHRLLNAIEPGSYVPPHRHLDPNKDELMLVLAGRLGLVWFDEAGTITGQTELQAGGEVLGVDIPVGVYHTVLALAPGTICLEAKAGPYRPLLAQEQAPWAPQEADAAAAAYLARLQALF